MRALVQLLGERKQRRAFDQVDLVEDQHLRLPHIWRAASRIASVSSSSPRLASISTPTRSASCAPPQAVVTMARSSRRFGAKDARRVDEDELRVALDRDAADQRARGLHLVRDDRDLGADQRVDQRRLAGIGRADQRDEAAARSRLPCRAGARSAIGASDRNALARQHGGGRRLLGGALGAPDAFGRLAARAARP